jgi:hypothetical protein
MASPALGAELERLAGDPRPDVRLAALVRLAAAGDAGARRQLRDDALAGATSADPATRARAAQAAGALDRDDRAACSQLLRDPDLRVRAAAIDAVRADDVHAIEPVMAALADPRTSAGAIDAMERLGDCVTSAVTDTLDAVGFPASTVAGRVVRAARLAAPGTAREMLGRYVDHRDRLLGLTVLECVATPHPAPELLGATLDGVLLDDAHHAARIAGAMSACADLAHGSVLQRALEDEHDLIRSRVLAGRLARHGADRLGSALLALADERRHSLAMETFEVTLSRREAALSLPVLRHDLTPLERLAQLPAPPEGAPTDTSGWLTDMITDPNGNWRSPWLRACAMYVCMNDGLGFDRDRLRALGEPLVLELLDH